eukprot:m.209895 g.209895  ORF g.209895 m.209895 type:complete len:183 (-) comp24770_c0_seq1:24-572(-)
MSILQHASSQAPTSVARCGGDVPDGTNLDNTHASVARVDMHLSTIDSRGCHQLVSVATDPHPFPVPVWISQRMALEELAGGTLGSKGLLQQVQPCVFFALAECTAGQVGAHATGRKTRLCTSAVHSTVLTTTLKYSCTVTDSSLVEPSNHVAHSYNAQATSTCTDKDGVQTNATQKGTLYCF